MINIETFINYSTIITSLLFCLLPYLLVQDYLKREELKRLRYEVGKFKAYQDIQEHKINIVNEHPIFTDRYSLVTKDTLTIALQDLELHLRRLEDKKNI